MGFDLLLYEEKTNYSELIRIDTKISADEICDEIFTNEDGSLSLFCLGQSTLKQYSLDFQSNVTLILEYNVSEQIGDKCKKKQIKYLQDQQIILFYQCSKWKIILITNNQASTLIQAQMKYQQAQLSRLTFIDDVCFCEMSSNNLPIYLIENYFYVIVYHHVYDKKILNCLLIELPYRIQKLLLNQKCLTIILVNELDKNDSSIIQNQKYQEVLLNQNYSINNIHLYSNLVFLQNQFELNVLINIRINQTYQISNTSLHFFDFDNVFCQFDEKKNVLQFYKYQPLSVYIQPKQKYVYVIEKANLFKRNGNIQCFRLLSENYTQQKNQEYTDMILFQYNCENKQQILWNSKNPNYFKNDTYNIYSSQGNLKVSIRNDENVQHICFERFYKLYHRGMFQLKKITNSYICFQNQSFFYIYDCQQKRIVISLNIDKYHVLEYDIAYYFVNKSNNNDLTGIQFLDGSLQYFNLNLNELVTSVTKIYSSIFLQTNTSNLPFIIQINFDKIVKYYLQKNLYQPEPILFYFESKHLKLIQYLKVLAFQSKEFFRCFQFQEQQIIFIQTLGMLGCYCIFSIQDQTRSLFLYYLIDQELQQVQNYTFQNYSFYDPVKYQFNSLNLAILIEQNNYLYIAIFSYNMSSLQLDEIIATDNTFFKFDTNLLIFSLDQVWKQISLKQFQAELELDNFQLDTASQTFSFSKNEERSVELKIENKCFQLTSLVKTSIIEIQYKQNLKLNISEMFYGPISNLTILNNSNVVLKGPFQFIKTLKICDDQNTELCIRHYHFETRINDIIFEVLMQENQILRVIRTSKRNIQYDYYVTWIKQQYFLCVSQFINYLEIELIECSEKQGQICRIISNLKVDLTIDQINIINSKRVGNLIKLEGNNTQAFIVIDNINYNIKILPCFFIDIQQIENSDNEYIVLQQNMIDSNDLELAIYSTNLNQTYSLDINEKISSEFIIIGNFHKQAFNIKLVSCKYSEDLIKIKLLIIDQSFSELVSLNLNKQKNQIQLELQNQFRYQIQNSPFTVIDSYILQYVDDSILVLRNDTDDFSQFYQIQDDRKLIDYFHRSNFSYKITRLNTTHLIFSDAYLDILVFMEYELELENYDEAEQNFVLFAQNEVSNEKVSFQIHIIKKNLSFSNSTLLIQITCLIFILIYSRSRKAKSKNQKPNSQ
ncbi:unnamed protein product [Paramecium octaurelia]|uniref:Transmembrane protein n=1 Tax=Paramecium octaurelia TaxID=43137 RepID=A0A8S1YEH7_PAROT|nr:unnamed protein product [Paramecium octaurelia]